MTFMTEMLRRSFKAGDDKRDKGLTTPPDIERRDNILYGTDAAWQKLDVYRPKGTAGKLPVIVSIHGGGWTYGDKERYQWYCMNLAQRGFAVVNFTYRVAPEFKFPAGLVDTNLVFEWMFRNDEWFDMEKIYAVGDSAGAHMLTIYSAACTDPSYAARMGFETPRYPDGRPFVPAAVGLNCGIYEIDLGSKDTSALTKGLMDALLAEHGSDEEIALINPIPFINEKFPRAYIMTANKDPLAGPPTQKHIAEKLAAVGVSFVDKTYGTEEEPLNHVFHCNIKTEEAKICNDDECRFFLEG